MPRIIVQMPPPPATDNGGSEGCTPSGPYLAQSIFGFPEGSQYLHLFGVHGLSAADSVEWTTELGPDDYVAGQVDRHILAVVYVSGEGGSVTAIVNGVALGSADYLPV